MRQAFPIFGLVASAPVVYAYAATPRWAQAIAVSTDALFLYGGKTDFSNEFSYTSAPWNNDLLYLSLSTAWDPANAPWNLIGGSSNTSSAAQGPAVAWHTLSVYATGQLLLFGGNAGPSSDIVILTQNDSAALIDVFDRLAPTLTGESNAWAGEPERRMRHAAATSGGKVYIVGGEVADGSNNGLADHYVFDPSGPSFTQLPSANAPPDIYGHAALVLVDGRIIVFGGFSQSTGGLVSLGQVWIFDPSTREWLVASLNESTDMPSSRMDYCSVLLTDGRILIHGGSDAGFQNTFADGWILDTTQSPMVWLSVPALSQLGARKDHFCVSVGSQVIFGFGYSSNGPANATLQIYDVGSSSFVSSFTPMTTPPSLTTVPLALPTGGQPSSGSPGSGSAGTNPSGTGLDPSSLPSGTGSPGSSSPHPSPSTTSTPQGPESKPGSAHAAAIVGSVFGVIALVVAACAATYYVRRQRSLGSAFSPLDDDDSPSDQPPRGIPVLVDPQSVNEKGPRLGALGFGAAAGLLGFGAQRVTRRTRADMLADEDRSFDWESVRWTGSGRHSAASGHLSRNGSSWSSSAGSVRSRLSDAVASSLRALGIGGRKHPPSREASGAGWEKYGDPFADEVALMTEADAERPRGGAATSSYAYHDPFTDINADPEVLHDVGGDSDGESGYGVRILPPHPAIRTALPPTADFVPMSPLIEQASRASFTSSSQAHSSQTHSTPSGQSAKSYPPSGPNDTVSSGSLSHLSHIPSPRSPRPSSILDTPPPSSLLSTSGFVKRSNSWWARFTDAPFLPTRRVSDASTHRLMDDFRDPNPPPSRLRPIEESSHSRPSGAPTSYKNATPAAHTGNEEYSKLLKSEHGRSVSSFQTANSETIARAGGMVVVQREGTYDSNASTSPHADEFGRPLALRTASEATTSSVTSHIADEMRDRTRTPTGETPLATTVESIPELPPVVIPPSAPRPPSEVSRALSPGSVAERVKLYERRMSADADAVPTRRSAIRYGLAPRAPLFVANPDTDAPHS